MSSSNYNIRLDDDLRTRTNATTLAAMQEIIDDRTTRHLKRYDNVEAMMKDIQEWQE